MRSIVGRRYKDLVRQIVTDQGGEALIAETRLQLIRRFAAGSCLAEALETRMANGEDIDVEQHCQLSSTLVRLSTRLGLDRNQKTVPSLRDYLAAKSSPVEIDNEAAE